MFKKVFLAFALGALISVLFAKYELALAFSALIIVTLNVYYLNRIGHMVSGILPLLMVGGTLTCWVLGFLGCIYLLGSTGYSIGVYTIQTMVLVNIFLVGSLVGMFLAFLILGHKPEREVIYNLPESQVVKGLIITLAVLSIWTILSYIGGILTGRALLGKFISPESLLYFTSAFSAVQYLFFFFLGAYMKEPFISRRNLLILATLVVFGILFALPGGREISLRIIFVFLAGVLFSHLKLKNFRIIVSFFAVFAVMLIFVIGYIRSYGDFTQKNIKERVDLIIEVAKKHEPLYNNEYDNPLYSVFTRIAEPSGQIVIDSTVQGMPYAGFINFDRLRYLYTPKFIDKNKPPMDDSSERLFTEYNVPYSEFTSSPITLLADSFARWGYTGVFVTALILSFILSFVGRAFYSIKNKLWSAVLIIYFASVALRLYALSVLGNINVIAYILPRDIVIIIIVMLIISAFPNQSGSSN